MVQKLNIPKTRKLYIDGKFVRSESERIIKWETSDKKQSINISRASRKDIRDSVNSARKAWQNWKNRTAYNRGQILYRMGEMLDSRKDQFIQELQLSGLNNQNATLEVEKSIEQCIYYAGWSDKFQQIFGRVNPVAGPYFSFTVPEPMGVVTILSSNYHPLWNAVSNLCSVIVAGNTTILHYSETNPLTAISLAEVVHTSDIPPGVVNILTGYRDEMLFPLATHMDVNAIIYCGDDLAEIKEVQEHSSLNIKRCIFLNEKDLDNTLHMGPYTILRTLEMKTTWHPIGV